MKVPLLGAVILAALLVGGSASANDFGWTLSESSTSPTANAGDPVAGICHARSVNRDLPPQWLVYITVEDLMASIDTCERLGGKVVFGPKEMGDGSRYCVIQDPAGAYAAVYEEK